MLIIIKNTKKIHNKIVDLENKMNSLKIVVVFYLIFTLSLNRKKVGREQEF